MNLNKIIQNLFPNTEYTLEKTDLGLTNINYILTTPTQKYMIRLPYSDELKIVDFQHEYEAIKLTRDYNLDVPIFYYDKKTGIKITYYIEDTYTYQTCPFTNKIERVAHLMKKFHSINKTSPYDFNPLIRYEQYKQQIKNPIYDLSFAEGIIDKIKKIAASTTLCHNDWVDGNILFAENKTYLIDYEYAGNNDPLFDVMSFLTENNINDNILRNRFYSIYFDSLDETTKNKLDLWEAFHHLLWCNWAMMMYESRSKSIYKEIAKEKYLSLEEKIHTLKLMEVL